MLKIRGVFGWRAAEQGADHRFLWNSERAEVSSETRKVRRNTGRDGRGWRPGTVRTRPGISSEICKTRRGTGRNGGEQGRRAGAEGAADGISSETRKTRSRAERDGSAVTAPVAGPVPPPACPHAAGSGRGQRR